MSAGSAVRAREHTPASTSRRHRAQSFPSSAHPTRHTSGVPSTRWEGVRDGGIATLPDARDAGPLNEVRGARRERQTLYAGKGQRPRLTPQNRHRARRPASRSGLLRSFPGAPSWRHPILRPHPTQADASTAPPRGMSAGSVQAGLMGGDKIQSVEGSNGSRAPWRTCRMTTSSSSTV